MLVVLSLSLLPVSARGASAQVISTDSLVIDTAPVIQPPRRSPDWTWVLLGTGVGLIAAGLGTGAGALVIQSDLDAVCTRTCPRSYGGYQMEGRVLAVTTDVLWLSGLVLSALGLATALTLQVSVEEGAPSVALACDGHGCFGNVTGTF
jgi:hypothetical protein